MDPNLRLSGRTGPAVGAASRSRGNAPRRSHLKDSLKALKASCLQKVTHLQVVLPERSILHFNPIKSARALSQPDDSLRRAISAIPPPLVKSLASTWSTTSSQPVVTSADTGHTSDNKITTKPGNHLGLAREEQASMPLLVEHMSKQKRKEGTEHDAAPSRRTRVKSASTRTSAPNLQEWVKEQQVLTPVALAYEPTEEEVRDIRLPLAVSRSSTLDSGPQPGHPQQTSTQPHHRFAERERRDSTATSSRSTNRESIFSTYTVRTAFTSPSEVSLSSASIRPHRASSHISKLSSPSPRSSMPPTPPPLACTSRTAPGHSVGILNEVDVSGGAMQGQILTTPVPAIPLIDPSKSQQTQIVLGLDLRDPNSAVGVDQLVKMGHMAQERRLQGWKSPILPLNAHGNTTNPHVSRPEDSPGGIVETLTPINEVASDDGCSLTPVPTCAPRTQAADVDLSQSRSPEPAAAVDECPNDYANTFELTERCRTFNGESGYGGGSKSGSPSNQSFITQPSHLSISGRIQLVRTYSTVDDGSWAMAQQTPKSHSLHNIVNELERLQSQVKVQKQGYLLDNTCSLEATEAMAGPVPQTPQSPGLSDKETLTVVADSRTSRGPSLTPATSVADRSEAPGMASSDENENIDDSASDFTDYTDESLFEAAEAFDPALRNPLILSIIQDFNKEVIRLVLARLSDLQAGSHAIVQHHDGQSGGGSAPIVFSSNGPPQRRGRAAPQRAARKRPLDNEEDESDDDEQDEKRKKPRGGFNKSVDPLQQPRKLACPFYKRYPGVKWKSKSCYGPGYPTAHRHKEHLYRYHNTPFCDRCHAIFDTQVDLDAHRRRQNACEVVNDPLRHYGITPAQIAQLKCRKKREGEERLSEEAKWKKMFLILFPDVPEHEVPSPYYDETGESLLTAANAYSVRQFLCEDLPHRMLPQVQEALARLQLRSLPEDETFRMQLLDIISESIKAAMDNLPPQLTMQDQSTEHSTPELEPRPEPEPAREHYRQQPSMTDPSAAHNTAQIGSQFPSPMVPRRTRLVTLLDQPVPHVITGMPAQSMSHTGIANSPTAHAVYNQVASQGNEGFPSTPDFNNQLPGSSSALPAWSYGGMNYLSNPQGAVSHSGALPQSLAPTFQQNAGEPIPTSSAMLGQTYDWRQHYLMALPVQGTTFGDENNANFDNHDGYDHNNQYQGGTAPYNMPNAQFWYREGGEPYFGGENNRPWESSGSYYDYQQQQQYPL